MILPEYVLRCMEKLENAGFSAYAVGGCVRDAVLGLTPHDYDLCTGATPEQMRGIFAGERLVLAGEKHGTVGVVTDEGVVEITTFRTEGGYQDNRHPDWVRFVPTVEEDLSRRDFTVNAMAYSPTRGFADPFGGREDLKNCVLRAVGDPETRFREDALRILRGVRFAVRFRLAPEEATLSAMERLAPLLNNLAAERVFSELCKLIPLVTAQDLLLYQPVLAQVIPELAPTMGFDQRSPHHAFDVFTHTAHVVEAVPPKLHLRLAALLHDVGKPACFQPDETGRGHFPGHAQEGARIANAVLLRLKAPTALREQVVALIDRHMTPLKPDRKLLRRRIGQYGTEGVRDLLELQSGDFCSKGVLHSDESDIFPQIRELLCRIEEEDTCFQMKDLAVSGSDLIALGYQPGKKIGAALNYLLLQVIDENLPNAREALLDAAKTYLEDTV